MSKQKEEKEKKNRKVLFGILSLLLAVGILTGSLVAFFSDYITGTGAVTAGTLNITGTYQYYVNGGTAVASVPNFNPGDVVVAKAAITNGGNKSAWLQDVIDLGTLDAGIAPYIKVCAGEQTQAQAVSCAALTLTAGKYTSSAQVILNGSGTGAEIETTGGGAPVAGVTTYNSAYTIYFLPTALNAAQGKVVNVTARTNAIQYRNNPTPVWTTIEQII